MGLIGALIVWRFFHDTPQSKGLPAVNAPAAKKAVDSVETDEFNRAQKSVLRNPAIWILAFSSAFMYISRYAVNSWGVFYLQAEKGYSTVRCAALWGRCFPELSLTVFSAGVVISRP